MTLPSIAERLREVADVVTQGCRPGWHQRFISVEEDVVSQSEFKDPWGCNCTIASHIRSLASEVEEVAKEMRASRGHWTITPGLQGGQTEDAVQGAKVGAWASRLATQEEKP